MSIELTFSQEKRERVQRAINGGTHLLRQTRKAKFQISRTNLLAKLDHCREIFCWHFFMTKFLDPPPTMKI